MSKSGPVVTIEISKHLVKDGNTPATKLLQESGYEYLYEMSDQSLLGRLPTPARKLVSTLGAVFLNYRHKPRLELRKIEKLLPKSYAMLICSKYPLD